MHTVNMPDKSKRTRIVLAMLDPSKLERGHAPHRTGAGTHHDRRTKLAKSWRSAESGAGRGVKGADRDVRDQEELDNRGRVPGP